jgi:adrenodoxin-NADP+ reductase
VIDENKKMLPGLYVCGWLKRGPVGIIDATLRDTKETFGVLRHHIETDLLP